MKKIYKLIFPFVCLICFWACEDDKDNNQYYQDPTTFVLNTPPYVSGIYDLENTKSLQLTCSQPDYGFTASVIYRVEVSLDKDFTNFSSLPSTYSTAKIEADAFEIAFAVTGLLGVETEADYPSDPIPLYVRLKASLADAQGAILEKGTIISNVVKLPKVKGYFALSPMEMPTAMYLIGNVNGWDWGKSTRMIPVHSGEGQFWCLQYLGQVDGADAEFKFNQTKAWDNTAFGIKDANIDNASKALAGISGDDNIKVGNPGWYIVVVKTEISGRNYTYRVQIKEPDVYLFGDAAGGSWGADPAWLFTVPNISLGADADFVSPAFIAPITGDAGLRACVVLDGHDWWHSEFMVFDGKLEYRGTGGDRIPRVMDVAVGQKLYINFTAGTGKIE